MNPRLLFITSHYFYQLTLDALARLNPGCQTKVVPYDDFSHIPAIYRQYEDLCDAVFVSGVSAKRVLQMHCSIDKPVTAFQVDSDALHRDILRFAIENQSLDFSRVAMDFLLPMGSGCSVTDFLALDNIQDVFTRNQDWMHDAHVQEHGAEELILEGIKDLWERKQIDCVICMYSGNIPKLQQLGIPWRCPFLSDAHLNRLIRDALVKIELKHLHDNHPAVIQIFPLSCAAMPAEQGRHLEEEVRGFLKTNLIEGVVQRNEVCCTVITSMQVARFLTNEFSCCRLMGFLENCMDVRLMSGYGIGTTISHAMNNAQVASKEAKLQEKPFAMDSNGNLIGPLSGSTRSVISQSARLKLSDLAKRASLSAMTIQKLMAVLHNRGSDKITTQELAESLDTTIRNANRIMQNLLKGGFASPVYTQTSHSRGRPIQVYSLDFGGKIL